MHLLNAGVRVDGVSLSASTTTISGIHIHEIVTATCWKEVTEIVIAAKSLDF